MIMNGKNSSGTPSKQRCFTAMTLASVGKAATPAKRAIELHVSGRALRETVQNESLIARGNMAEETEAVSNQLNCD